MSLIKYAQVEQMGRVIRYTGNELGQRIRATWARARRLSCAIFTPGLQKFKTIEEAQEMRQNRIYERMRTLRQERVPQSPSHDA